MRSLKGPRQTDNAALSTDGVTFNKGRGMRKIMNDGERYT